MKPEQLQILKDAYMKESTKPNGNRSTLGEYMRFCLDGGVDFVTSKDLVVFDDTNEMLHCVCINDDMKSQADFPIKVMSSEYAIVQQVETVMSQKNFEKFLEEEFINNAISNEKKEFMLKWSKTINNQALQPMDSEPAYNTNPKITPKGTSKIEREDYEPAVAMVVSAKGEKSFYKDFEEAFENLKDGDKIYLKDDVSLDKKLIFDDNITIYIYLNGKTLRSTYRGTSDTDAAFEFKNGKVFIKQNEFGYITALDLCIAVDGRENPVTLDIDEDIMISSLKKSCIFACGNATVNIRGCLNARNFENHSPCLLGSDLGEEYDGTVINLDGATIQGGGYGIYHPQNGVLNISSTSIEAYTGVYMKAGELNMSSGEIEAFGESTGFNDEYPTGGAIVADFGGYPNKYPKISITGGSLSSSKMESIMACRGDVYNAETFTEEAAGNIVLSGGVYTQMPKMEYCADGYEVSFSGGAISTLFEVIPISVKGFIGSADGTKTEFTTLNNAFENLHDNDVIHLTKSTIVNDTILMDSEISATLEIYENATVYSEASTCFRVKEGDLTVLGEGRITTKGESFRVSAKDGTSTPFLEIGKDISVTSENDSCVFIYGTATANIKGSLFSNGIYSTIQGNGLASSNGTNIILDGAKISGSSDICIYHPQDGNLTIDNGSVVNGSTAIYMKAGTLTVGKAKIVATGLAENYEFNGNGAKGTGDAIVADFCVYPGGTPKVNILQADIYSEYGNCIECYDRDGNTNPEGAKESVNVYGKYFNKEINPDYIAEGYSMKQIKENKYIVDIDTAL